MVLPLVAFSTRLTEREEMFSDCEYTGCDNLMITTVRSGFDRTTYTLTTHADDIASYYTTTHKSYSYSYM